MRKSYLLTLGCAAFLQASVAQGSALEWSGGAKDIVVTAAKACTLYVETTNTLPSDWNLVWVARASTENPIQVEARESSSGVADVSEIKEGPRLWTDAHVDTAVFGGTSSLRASRARYVLRIDANTRANILLAFDDLDQPTSEVTVNGGTRDAYPPAIFTIVRSRSSDSLSIDVTGRFFQRVATARFVPHSTGSALWLDVTQVDAQHLRLRTRAPYALGAGHVELHDAVGGTTVAPLEADGSVDPRLPYPDYLVVRFRPGHIDTPAGSGVVNIADCSYLRSALRDSLVELGAVSMERLFPSFRHSDVHTTNDLGEPVTLHDLADIYVVRLGSNADPRASARGMGLLNDVQYAACDLYKMTVTAMSSTDPLYEDEWYHKLQSSRICGDYATYAGITLGTEDAWNTTTGAAQVRVAILDTGVRTDHLDLAPRVQLGPTFDPSTVSSEDNSPNRHGTAVAGIVAADGANGVGIAGVAWAVTPVAVKVVDQSGGGQPSWISKGIAWADSAGIPILNLSLAVPYDDFDPDPANLNSVNVMNDACYNAFIRGRLVVAAAGNIYSEIGLQALAYPVGFIQRVLGVEAILPTAERWDDAVLSPGVCSSYPGYCLASNFGTTENPIVDVDAPGGRLTLAPYTEPNSYYDLSTCNLLNLVGTGFGGTSAAAAQVSGVAALLKSARPELTGEDLAQLLELTSINYYGPSGGPWDAEHGYGFVRADLAMEKIAASRTIAHWMVGGGLPGEIGSLTAVDSAVVTVRFVDEPDMPSGDYTTSCVRYRLTGTATFPFGFSTAPLMWVRASGTEGWRDTTVVDYNYEVNWGGVARVGDGTGAATVETYVYRVRDNADSNVTIGWFPATPGEAHVALTAIGPTAGVGVDDSPIAGFKMVVRPNPTVRHAVVDLVIPRTGMVRVGVVDLAGRKIADVWSGEVPAGGRSFSWGGRTLAGERCAAGVYFVKVQYAGVTETKQFVLLGQ